MTTTTVHVCLLGGFALRAGDRDIDVPPGARRLIALVALARGPVPRARAASTLWPDLPEPRAAGNLRSALWRLRRTGESPVMQVNAELALTPGVHVDVHDMERWTRELLEMPDAAGELPPATVFDAELLPDWYEDWVSFERERLRQLGLHALEVLARRFSTRGQYGLAIEAANRAVQGEPLRESATRALIEVHLAEDNPSEAVREYLMFRERLRTELGLEPSGAMRALVMPLVQSGLRAGRQLDRVQAAADAQAGRVA